MRRFFIDESFFEDWLWQDVVAFRLLVYLVWKAAFKDGVKMGKIELKRGQFLRSYRNLQHDLRYLKDEMEKVYTVKTIKRRVELLIAKGQITVLECPGGTLFTLTHYESYQTFEPPELAEKQLGADNEKTASPKMTQQTLAFTEPTIPPASPGNISASVDPIWGDGLRLLLEAGVKEPNARAFLGRALKQYGEEALDEAISAALLNDPADPKSYLMGCLKKQRDEKDREAEERRYMTPGERRTQECIDDFMRTYRCGN